MREMKDSGIEWIGEIPADWDVVYGKHHFSNKKTIPGIHSVNFDRLALTLKGVVLRSKEDSDGLQPKDFDTYQLLSINELVFKLIDLQNTSTSRVGLAHNTGLVSPAYIVLHPKADINPQFAEYYYLMLWHRQIFNALGDNGVRSNLSVSDLLNIKLPLTSLKIQTRIANFLDSKRAEIDALIADIQSEIDVLEQYKKSVITEAVTKGLDPNAEMKDSGLSWVTKIPSTWHIIPSKFLFHNSDLRRMSGDLQLTSSQKYGIISQSEYMERENVKIVLANQGVDNWKHVEPNDFIISLRSFQGGLEMSEVTGCITWHYVVLKASRPIVPQFYKWLFKSSVYINALQGTANFIRDGQDLRFSNFSKVPLYEPPLAEQKAIAEYLEEKCSKIDTTISDKQEQINLLFAYKKSLIYEYVTGKKEVPTINLASVVTVDPQVILLGGIVKRIGNSQHGRTQLQKLLYLCNTHLGMNQNIQYYRYEHGPYDVHLNEYIRELVKNQWFNEKSQDKNCLLVSGKKWQEFEQNYPNPFGEKKKEISELFKQLKNLSTKQIERIATLYAAWNDFLLDGITPSDDQIIQDVVTNWTENKANFKHSTWQESLNQMKQFGLIPKGTGLHTLPKPEKGGLNNE